MFWSIWKITFFETLNFSLCVLEDANAPESGEDCFQPLTLGDGSSTYVLPNKQEEGPTTVDLTVKLPDGLTCERCVFRWNYNAGTVTNNSLSYYCQIVLKHLSHNFFFSLFSGFYFCLLGNNWGDCDDGTSAMGCGPQETFRSCSDIVIS
jgi:hypothetical protein